MQVSAEARWFWPGEPPRGFEKWFYNREKHPCPFGGGELRLDTYLLDRGGRCPTAVLRLRTGRGAFPYCKTTSQTPAVVRPARTIVPPQILASSLPPHDRQSH